MFSDFSRRRFLQSTLAGTSMLTGGVSLAGTGDARATTGRKTDKLRLTWGFSGLILISRERGELEKRLAKDGIKVEWIGPFPNHAPTLRAVTGGTADFGFGGSTTPALAAIIAGSPLVFSQFVIYEPRTTSIIAKKKSGIKRVEDLVDKSVAVNRSGLGEFLLVAALEKHKIDRSKVNFVYLNPPDAAPALASDKVDAWSMWSPGVDIARFNLDAVDIFNEGRDLDFMIDFSSFVTHRKFAEDNPDILRAFHAALRAEGDWISKNTAEAEKIAQSRGKYSDQVTDYLTSLKRQYRFYDANDQDFLNKLQFAADWLSERKILTSKVTVRNHLSKL